MAIDKDFLDALRKNTELVGGLVEQASTLKDGMDALLAENQKLTEDKEKLRRIRKYNDKRMRHRMLSQWELRARFAYASLNMFRSIRRRSNGWLYSRDGDVPFVSYSDSKKVLRPERDWVVMWEKIERLVRAHLEKVRRMVEDMDNRDIPTYGIVSATVENTDDSFRVGNKIWAAFNTDKDDGQGGIKKCEDGYYVYTWDAAKRIADSIPGWHIPTDDDYMDMFIVFGVSDHRFCLKVPGINKLFGVGACLWSSTRTADGWQSMWRIKPTDEVSHMFCKPDGYYKLRLVKD